MSAAGRVLRVELVRGLVTVQDQGRVGYGAIGVGVSGAADRTSHDLANRLVGNGPDAASLEITFGELEVVPSQLIWVAITGAECDLVVEGVVHPPNSLAVVRPGQRARVGPPRSGARSYLAVRGGIAVDLVLGSRSTDTLSGLGPEPIVAGDVLPVGEDAEPFPEVGDAPVGSPWRAERLVLDVLPGPRDGWFTPEAQARFVGSEWRVSPDSNRVGVRLVGPALDRLVEGELASEGMPVGAVQVPPSGPIVLLDDHPVTGGYPVIAVVFRESLDLLAQARPGQVVTFRNRPADRTPGGRSTPPGLAWG